MNGINLQNINLMKIGFRIALIPATVTSLIACSKILLVNLIAETVVRILTFNTGSSSIYGVSFVAVPLLWKFSAYTAMIGGALVAISCLACVVQNIYRKIFPIH